MSSLVPRLPGPPPASLMLRMRRREPLLGVLGLTWPEPVGLDFVVFDALTPLAVAHASGAAVLIRVDDPGQVAAVLAGGAEGIVATVGDATGAAAIVTAVREQRDALVLLDGPPELETTPGVDGVFGGRVRLARSPETARDEFAAGATVVIYDLPLMVSDLIATLEAGRPACAAPDAREPLVLLSGMLGDSSLWDGVAQRLADVVLPWPARIDLDDSVAEMAKTVLAAAPARFALAGHSLGAIAALEMVRQAPDRVSRLVLLNASGRGPSPVQEQAWATWRERTERGEFAAVVDELARDTLAPAHRDDADLVSRNAAMAATVGAAGFLRQLAAQATRPDSLESMRGIDVPVLALSGAADEICPPALQRELVDACPAAMLVSVPGGGHMLPLEAPDETAEAIRSWLLCQ